MQLTELFEAKISGANVGSAMAKIVSYLERNMQFKLVKLGVEHFKNSQGEGHGVRYVVDGETSCIRFNWVGSKSSEIVSVDLWNGSSRDPNFNISFKDTSLAKSLPALLSVLKKPKVGTVKVAGELALHEARKGEFTPESAVADMVAKLEDGRSFNRSEFVMNYHPENAHAYDEFVEKHKDELVIKGKRISLEPGTKLGQKKAKPAAGKEIKGGGGELVVKKGGSGEEYDVEVPDVDRVTFAESLEHLEGLTTGLIKGSFNALFVAGRGGTGKTQTVEDTFAEHGLSDGQGYYKLTGSASPIGIYTTLYKNRNGIVMFDDCDGALETQDGRNIIKAATDTKKSRKVAWGKKSSSMYDPADGTPKKKGKGKTSDDDEDLSDDDGAEHEDSNDDGDSDRIPNNFEFTGRVLFISNLPLNKLDPDGALRTRAFIISIDPTPEEIFERMGEIVDHIKLEAGSLTPKERQEVLEVVKTSKNAANASLRTLVRALGLAASGAKNWKVLVQRYA